MEFIRYILGITGTATEQTVMDAVSQELREHRRDVVDSNNARAQQANETINEHVGPFGAGILTTITDTLRRDANDGARRAISERERQIGDITRETSKGAQDAILGEGENTNAYTAHKPTRENTSEAPRQLNSHQGANNTPSIQEKQPEIQINDTSERDVTLHAVPDKPTAPVIGKIGPGSANDAQYDGTSFAGQHDDRTAADATSSFMGATNAQRLNSFQKVARWDQDLREMSQEDVTQIQEHLNNVLGTKLDVDGFGTLKINRGIASGNIQNLGQTQQAIQKYIEDRPDINSLADLQTQLRSDAEPTAPSFIMANGGAMNAA